MEAVAILFIITFAPIIIAQITIGIEEILFDKKK